MLLLIIKLGAIFGTSQHFKACHILYNVKRLHKLEFALYNTADSLLNSVGAYISFQTPCLYKFIHTVISVEYFGPGKGIYYSLLGAY